MGEGQECEDVEALEDSGMHYDKGLDLFFAQET